jgi:phosphatidylglycerophosphatase A
MKRIIIYLIATGFGSGYAPVASGTAGSLFALILFILFPLDSFIWLGIICLTFITGIWAASIVEADTEKDPKIVVVDEIAGQWIALIFLPESYGIYIAAFFLFRFFDIVKAYPANKLEALPAGSGIMMDDVVAGIYTNIVLQLIYRFIL